MNFDVLFLHLKKYNCYKSRRLNWISETYYYNHFSFQLKTGIGELNFTNMVRHRINFMKAIFKKILKHINTGAETLFIGFLT